MQAVILSAGEGTRLRPLTNTLPKVMVPIQGKPLLQWHIEHVRKFGIREILINLHYLPNIITDYFKDGEKFGVKIIYSYEEKLLGSGGALLPFKRYITDTFFLLYGDVFTNININKLEKFHRGKKAEVSIVVRKTDHPKDSDLVAFSDELRVINFYFKPHEKLPTTMYGLAAIYMFDPTVLQLLPQQSPYDLARDFLPKIYKDNRAIFCYNTEAFIKDIGTESRYNHVLELLKNDYFKNTSSD